MKINRFSLAVVLPLFLFAILSCTKPDDNIGYGILPSTDKVSTFFTDTASIYGFTVAEDSLPVSGFATPLSYNILGSYTDPVFGTTDAALYAQMNLTKSNFSFGDSPQADSIVLCLAIKDYYGDTLTPLHFKVYQLEENIIDDSVYYSDKNFSYSYQIGDATTMVLPHDSSGESDVKKAPHVRIKLYNSLAYQLIQQGGSANFVDNNAFISYFKGLYIVPESITGTGQGCLFSFDYKNSQSKVSLYYHLAGEDAQQILNFSLDDRSRVNNFKHNYSGTELSMQLADTSSGANYVSAQSMAGVKIKLKMPNLASFSENNIAINRAVLILKADASDPKYPVHAKLAIAQVDSTGKAEILPDSYETSNANDGYLNKTTNEYKFNITRYMERVATGKQKDYGLYILPSGAVVNMYRTKIFGYNNPSGKIRVEVNYAKY